MRARMRARAWFGFIFLLFLLGLDLVSGRESGRKRVQWGRGKGSEWTVSQGFKGKSIGMGVVEDWV